MIAKESKERCEAALNEYIHSGISLRDLSIKYGIPRSFISGYILGKGIDIYSRKSHVNTELFQCIDTEEKAYWLGMMFADGCIYWHATSYKIELTLKESDLEHLLKFKKFLDWDKEPKYRPNQKAYRVMFSCRKLAEDLMDLGCVRRKSLILKFPTKVPDNLIRHFIRGYFDGDGCISVKHNVKSDVPIVSLLGTFEFLQSLIEVFKMEYTPIKKCKKNSSNTYYIRFKKEDAYKFLHYIYDDASIYLQRKYDKYQICRAFE